MIGVTLTVTGPDTLDTTESVCVIPHILLTSILSPMLNASAILRMAP